MTTKIGQKRSSLAKDIGQTINFVAYRPRWVAAASGEVKLSAKMAYNFFNSIITINLYNNITIIKTTINIIINILELAAKGGLQVLQHQSSQRYLPYMVGWEC